MIKLPWEGRRSFEGVRKNRSYVQHGVFPTH